MMIDTSKIYNYYVNISYLLKEYENNCSNFYKELMEISNYWNDGKVGRFLEATNKEKFEAEQFIEKMTELCETYKYIQESYLKIGKTIYFDENRYPLAISKFNSCIDSIKSILTKYANLNLDVGVPEAVRIKKQSEDLQNKLDDLMGMKESIQDKCDSIIKIEQSIKEKLSKIKVNLIKESDINES